MLLISCQGSAGVLRMTSNNRQHLFLAFCVTVLQESVPLHSSPKLQRLCSHRCRQEHCGERRMDLLYDFDWAKMLRKCTLFDLALLQRVIFSSLLVPAAGPDATRSKQWLRKDALTSVGTRTYSSDSPEEYLKVFFFSISWIQVLCLSEQLGWSRPVHNSFLGDGKFACVQNVNDSEMPCKWSSL